MSDYSAVELTRDSPTPLYAQLEEILRHRISSKEWQPGDRIPSESELHRTYGLSRMTVRGVLNTLAADGLLFRVPGKGTFVSEDKIEALSPGYRGIREQLESQGIATTTRLLSLRTKPATAEVAAGLGVARETPVFAVERVRSANGTPVSLHRTWIPVSLAPTLDRHDLAAQQLCVVLDEHFGLRMARVEEQLESAALRAGEARALEAPEGLPILVLTDTLSTESDVAFEYSKVVFRGDKMRLHFSLRA